MQSVPFVMFEFFSEKLEKATVHFADAAEKSITGMNSTTEHTERKEKEK